MFERFTAAAASVALATASTAWAQCPSGQAVPGVAYTTGAVLQIAPPLSVDDGQTICNTAVMVFQELSNVVCLEDELNVNLIAPGTYEQGNTPAEVLHPDGLAISPSRHICCTLTLMVSMRPSRVPSLSTEKFLR